MLAGQCKWLHHCNWSDSLSLVSYLTKRFDERFQLKFFSFIIVTMIVVMIIVLSIGVLLPVGFKFLRSVYAKLELHAKLWSIIKPKFHSDDWELTGQKEVPFFFYGCFPVTMLPWVPLLLLHLRTGSNQLSIIARICLIFIEPLLFLPPLPSLEDPSAQVRASVAASLAVFPMYLVWGFGRMGIRLARWLYNKSKAQIKDILSSVSAYSMPMSNQTQRGGRVLWKTSKQNKFIDSSYNLFWFRSLIAAGDFVWSVPWIWREIKKERKKEYRFSRLASDLLGLGGLRFTPTLYFYFLPWDCYLP